MKQIDRQAEEQYLSQTLAVVEKNLEIYTRESTRMQSEIDEMLEHYHDADVELWTLLNNTITLNEHMKRALQRNERAKEKPYFGRIIFHDESLDKEESLYIGKGGVSSDHTTQVVVDWRAPVANAYYENGLGKCSYTSPDGKELPIDLQLKRTFEIESGRLLDYFDTEVVANDDLLMKYLSKSKEAVLGEIVATIQKEQNEIIRKTPFHNVIVQGVAGSGKTTVAMHRISYILYNYKERFRPEDFYIVGSNRILLNYITGVLPDLDVYGVRQMTMEQLFVRLLYEDWDEKKYKIKSVSGSRDIVKGTEQWYLDLVAFIREVERESISTDSIYLNPRQFVEGLRDGQSGIYDKTSEDKAAGRSPQLVRLIAKDAVQRYITQNPAVSIQSKINMLNERLLTKVREEFLGKGVKYTEGERKAILKAYRGWYGGKIWKQSIYTLYDRFLAKQRERGYDITPPTNTFDVYDLAALALLYKLVKETEIISEAHHIVIDEAQDFGMMAYHVLHDCIKDCTYTIMGDVSQNIHFGYGLADWEALRGLLLTDPMDSFGILKKSYRNTVEISDFATNILRHGNFPIYPVEPIIRHGTPVLEKRLTDRDNPAKEAADICRNWQKSGYDTIAVVCRNEKQAAEVAEALSAFIHIMESDLEKASFGNGILVLPVEYTKGLEFDAVLIWEPNREDYPVDNGHARLLYVAATRALHELCILYRENLTGLIAEPVPERELSAQANQKPTDIQPTQEQLQPTQQKLPSTQTKLHPTQAKLQSTQPKLQSGKTETAVKANAPGRKKIVIRTVEPAQTPPAQRPATNYSSSAIPDRRSAASHSGSAMPDRRSASSHSSSAIPDRRSAASHSGSAMPDRRSAASHSGSAMPDRRSASSYSSVSASVSPAVGNPRRQNSATKENAPLFLRGKAYCLNAEHFGDMPLTEQLRPAGHARSNLAIRWTMKQEDGLYLQSQYGILRISPVGSAIVRVTFARGNKLVADKHPLIATTHVEKNWKYRDNGKQVDFSCGELLLRVDKTSGAIQYLDAAGKLLLAEHRQESRQQEANRSWLYLDFQKGEQLYAMEGKGLPLILSDKCYGLVPVSEGKSICCDITAYGSYLYTETAQQDFYFIAGKQQQTILSAYSYLLGLL